jgi:hypothetical protein
VIGKITWLGTRSGGDRRKANDGKCQRGITKIRGADDHLGKEEA